MESWIRLITRITAPLLFIFTIDINAAKLSDFEKDIIESQSSLSRTTQHHNNCYDCGSSNHDSFFDALLGGIFEDMLESVEKDISIGADTSHQRIDGKPNQPGISERKHGEILIPFYRLNINTQYVSEKINALDLKMEIGKGPNGFEVRSTTYKDDSADEKLKYSQLQYFHRMSFGNNIGINLGLGYARMKVTESFEGLVLSLPVLFHNGRHIGFEIRPSVFDADGSNITELDISALYTYRKLAFRAGYRTLDSPGIKLDGFYAGFDFIF